jgi:hypothetical protein
MWIRNLFDFLKPGRSRTPIQHARRNPTSRRPVAGRLSVEPLEDRCVPAVMLTIGDATVLEGNTGFQNAVVTVSVTEPHNNALSVNYRTADRAATAGSDYNAVSGTLTFAKNEMSKTILVPVIGDRVPEPNEYFFVQLSNAKGAKIADAQAAVTIVDDEPRISINNASLAEGNSGSAPMSFTVSLSAAYDLPVTVNYATADRRAKAGTDYTAASGTLVFEPGQTTQTITVLVIGNRSAELGWYKTFLVNLSTPNSYAAISDTGMGVGYIAEDEPQIAIAADAYHGETTYTFTVSLSAAYDQPVTFDFTTADGTAIAGVDYGAAAGTLTFAIGETSKTITVGVLDASSADKYFVVYLSGASTNAVLANEGAIGDLYIYDGYNYGSTGYDPYPYGM